MDSNDNSLHTNSNQSSSHHSSSHHHHHHHHHHRRSFKSRLWSKIKSRFRKLEESIRHPSKKGKRTMAVLSCLLAVVLVVMAAVVYVQNAEQEKRLETISQEEESERAAAEQELQEQLSNLSVYEKLEGGYDVNILIVGDSIGAASGASDSDHRWTVLLGTYLQSTYGSSVTINNISLGGNTSFAGYVSTMILDDGKDYDLAIVCYGQNDSESDFSLYYETIIKAISSRYERCSIISILESSQKGYTDKILTIEEICEYYSIPVADTIDPTLEYYNFYTDDGLYPNDEGQAVYAETIEKVITKQISLGTGLPDYDLDPINKDVVKFTNCDYISVSEFTRENTLTYTANVTASGILGIDYSCQSGQNIARIYVDGELFISPTVTNSNSYSQRRILIVSDNCTVGSEIKIVFDSEAQAEGFYGICFCYE